MSSSALMWDFLIPHISLVYRSSISDEISSSISSSPSPKQFQRSLEKCSILRLNPVLKLAVQWKSVQVVLGTGWGYLKNNFVHFRRAFCCVVSFKAETLRASKQCTVYLCEKAAAFHTPVFLYPSPSWISPKSFCTCVPEVLKTNVLWKNFSGMS